MGVETFEPGDTMSKQATCPVCQSALDEAECSTCVTEIPCMGCKRTYLPNELRGGVCGGCSAVLAFTLGSRKGADSDTLGSLLSLDTPTYALLGVLGQAGEDAMNRETQTREPATKIVKPNRTFNSNLDLVPRPKTVAVDEETRTVLVGERVADRCAVACPFPSPIPTDLNKITLWTLGDTFLNFDAACEAWRNEIGGPTPAFMKAGKTKLRAGSKITVGDTLTALVVEALITQVRRALTNDWTSPLTSMSRVKNDDRYLALSPGRDASASGRSYAKSTPETALTTTLVFFALPSARRAAGLVNIAISGTK